MPNYKLALTDITEAREFMEHRKADVTDDYHPGLDRAIALSPTGSNFTVKDMHDWVERILDASVGASEKVLPGLIEALNCILAWEGPSSESLVDERRRR